MSQKPHCKRQVSVPSFVPLQRIMAKIRKAFSSYIFQGGRAQKIAEKMMCQTKNVANLGTIA